MSRTNRAVVLASRPHGQATHENFKVITQDLEKLKDGEVLLKNVYLSVDPYMRGKMTGAVDVTCFEGDMYELGKPLYGYGAGVVEESNNPAFARGDLVAGSPIPWTEFTIIPGSAVKSYNKLAPDTNLETALSVWGETGMTAYFGLLDVGQPKEGETVVVSGASGATGSIVGQIAKLKGCHVIGLAGSDEKVEWLLKDLGFDGAINYKTTKDLSKDIKEAVGKGIDVYFDNVGGEISDAVVPHMNDFGRIVHCGSISTYNATEQPTGPRFDWLMITKRLRAQGFIYLDYAGRFPEGIKQLTEWVIQGKIKHRVTVKKGLDSIIDAFLGLFDGTNIGKMLVKL